MIKAYTDIEQSRKLSKILPIETSDMAWVTDNDVIVVPFNEVARDNVLYAYTPCWSLAKLFKIIPVTIERAGNRCRLRMDKSEEDFDIWYEEVDSGLAQLDLDIITPNMVDACVEMIEKLHNEKLL